MGLGRVLTAIYVATSLAVVAPSLGTSMTHGQRLDDVVRATDAKVAPTEGIKSTLWTLPEYSDADELKIDSLRILNANLWMLPGFSVECKERLRKFADYANNSQPDIITLQEVWRHYTVGEIRKALPGYHVITSGEGWLFNHSGLVTLVNKNLGDRPAYDFMAFDTEEATWAEDIGNKGVLTVYLRANGKEYGIGNTHLHSSDDHDAVEAQRQLDEVPHGKLAFLIGDMNLDPEAIRAFADRYCMDDAGVTFSSDNPYRRRGIRTDDPSVHEKIDWLLVPKDRRDVAIQEARVLDLDMSDHSATWYVARLSKMK